MTWAGEGRRVFVEMEGLELDAAAVTIDGRYVGGVIGAPHRLDATDTLGPGAHTIRIEPCAPDAVRIMVHE